MLPHRLDSYQSKVKSGLKEHRLLIVNGEKYSGKSFLLRNICAEEVYNGKKVLLVVKDHQAVKEALRQFQQYFLKDQALELRPTFLIGHETLKRFRSNFSREKDSFDPLEINILHNEYHAYENQIKHYYEGINQLTLFNKSWHELVILQAFEKNSFQTLHFNQVFNPDLYCFEKDEYALMKRDLTNAFEFFVKGNAYTEKLFTAKSYEIEDAEIAWKEIANWIIEAKKRTTNLILSLTRFLQKKANEKEKELINNCRNTKIKLDQLLSKLKLYQSESVDETKTKNDFSLFSARGKVKKNDSSDPLFIIREEYHELVKETYSIVELKEYLGEYGSYDSNSTMSEMQTDLLALKEKFLDINKYLQNYVRNELYSININNADDLSVEKIDLELKNLYQFLNDQQIMDRVYENTAFSIQKQLLQLESVLSGLNDLLAYSGNFLKYYDWNVFYRSLDQKTKHLIDKLLIIQPKNWVILFRNWYIQNLIRKRKDPYYNKVDEELTAMYQNLAVYNRKYADRFRYEKRELLNEQEDQLKRKNRPLYKSLLKKNEHFEIRFAELLQDFPGFVSSVFPICVCSASDFIQLHPNSQEEWDVILFDECEGPDVLNIGALLQNGNSNSIIWASSRDEGDKIELGQTPEIIKALYTLKGYHQQNVIGLNDMVPTERLYAARNIAHLLQDTNRNICIYHIKDYIIFSCLSEVLNEVFEKILDSRNIKKMRVLESPFHLLVENILEVSTKQILITQDFLINNNAYDKIAWQMYIKERISRAGIQLADINTYKILDNPVPYLLDFIGKYLPEK